MKSVVYQAMTKQFGFGELKMLQDNGAEALAPALKGASPVVALRALAEVMLNNDEIKLSLLLADSELTAHWRAYESDFGLDWRDNQYALQLEEMLETMK